LWIFHVIDVSWVLKVRSPHCSCVALPCLASFRLATFLR
jgi:hypothetical protein